MYFCLRAGDQVIDRERIPDDVLRQIKAADEGAYFGERGVVMVMRMPVVVGLLKFARVVMLFPFHFTVNAYGYMRPRDAALLLL